MTDSAPSKSPDLSVREAEHLLRRLIDEAVSTTSDAYLLVENNYHLQRLARQAQQSFGLDGDSRSQMKKLEQVALSALTFGDVLNYVKNQTGRTTSAGRQWQAGQFGKQLHDVLWNQVRNNAESSADKVYKALPSAARKALEKERPLEYKKRDLERELRLRLVQAYVRHLVAQYTYLVATHEA